MRALILGGTGEANRLADALAYRKIDAIYCYAGRTQIPLRHTLPVRIGGFGGVNGLCDFIRGEQITHVIDATHPFAEKISRNAVGACRYPKLPDSPLYDPPGIRGDAPMRAARYWGLSQQDYYARADVWPLAPQGEILAILQCEDTRGIENLPRMLQEVPGIGVPELQLFLSMRCVA